MPDNAWDSLTEKQKRAIELLSRGLSHREAAFVLGISHQAVADRVARAFRTVSGLQDMAYRWGRARKPCRIR